MLLIRAEPICAGLDFRSDIAYPLAGMNNTSGSKRWRPKGRFAGHVGIGPFHQTAQNVSNAQSREGGVIVLPHK